MSALSPRDAVYALARTQLDWIPTVRPTIVSPDGFAHEQRYVSCPDCLANDRPTFGCETCHGRGEIPDAGRDPMENRNQSFFGDDNQRRRDRATAVDAQISRLDRQARARDNDPDALPEDWLSRAVRLKEQQWRRGDYGLLEHAQVELEKVWPSRHYAWWRFIVEHQALTVEAEGIVRFNDTADWLAAWILAEIATVIARGVEAAELLGIRRPRLRPSFIIVPPEHHPQPADQAGKGRWANTHQQGQRNALIVALSTDGKTAGEIARRVGLDKRRVQQILATVSIGVASGPAA